MLTTFIGDRIKGVLGVTSAAVTSTSAIATAIIDRLGFNTVILAVATGASSGNSVTVALFEGTASDTAATAVTLNGTPAVITTTAAAYTLYQFDVSGCQRYIKVTLTPGTTTSLMIGANFILGDAVNNPGSGTAVSILAKA